MKINVINPLRISQRNDRRVATSLVAASLLLTGCQSAYTNKSADTAHNSMLAHTTPHLIATVTGLPRVESVAYDQKRDVLYASVQSGDDTKTGYIAKLSTDGKTVDRSFITGLHKPKGIVVAGNKLYVSDVTKLVEVNLNTKKVTTYTGKNAQFLNDTTVDDAGNAYVSDMFTSSIYRLTPQGVFSNWLSSPTLENPNGLLAMGDNLYIGAWGRFNDKKPLNAPQGHFLKVNIATKRITTITNMPIGNLDGVQYIGNDSFLVSDWKAGTLMTVNQAGDTALYFTSEHSVGDILYVPNKNLLALPLNKQAQVRIYRMIQK